MKAFQLVSFLNVLGTRMQTVTAVEQEISIRQETDFVHEKVLLVAQTAATDTGGRNFVTANGKREEVGKREKKNKQPGGGPKDFLKEKPGQGL